MRKEYFFAFALGVLVMYIFLLHVDSLGIGAEKEEKVFLEAQERGYFNNGWLHESTVTANFLAKRNGYVEFKYDNGLDVWIRPNIVAYLSKKLTEKNKNRIIDSLVRYHNIGSVDYPDSIKVRIDTMILRLQGQDQLLLLEERL